MRRLVPALVASLVMLAMAACAPAQQAPTPAPEEAKPKYGGTLRNWYSTAIARFDLSREIQSESVKSNSLARNNLVTYRAGPQVDVYDSAIVAELAERWEFKDPSTLVFYLRKGVKFHNKPPVNGRELDSEDVKFTIERMLAGDHGYKAMYQSIKTVETPDKYTVVLKLDPPDADMLTNLAQGF